jgi:hypothetical protein
MLEALTPETLRSRLGFEAHADGGPTIGSVAEAVRSCVRAWRSPARARVTAYLHRQLRAAGFEENSVRARVSEVVDALIEVGDLTQVRLSGNQSLVLSRPQWISIAPDDYAFLGQDDPEMSAKCSAGGYVRRVATPAEHTAPVTLAEFMGPPGFRRHLARRTGGTGDGALSEFWAILDASVRHDGLPLDAGQLRAVVEPPGTHEGRFGRHNQPAVSGRWKTVVPDGTWCGVRPGRHANEWHPIVVGVTGSKILSLDLFDWDEWTWALLARAAAVGAPERSVWSNHTLSFEHPVPAQFLRAMRLLGAPGEWSWTWTLTQRANAAFAAWRETAL